MYYPIQIQRGVYDAWAAHLQSRIEGAKRQNTQTMTPERACTMPYIHSILSDRDRQACKALFHMGRGYHRRLVDQRRRTGPATQPVPFYFLEAGVQVKTQVAEEAVKFAPIAEKVRDGVVNMATMLAMLPDTKPGSWHSGDFGPSDRMKLVAEHFAEARGFDSRDRRRLNDYQKQQVADEIYNIFAAHHKEEINIYAGMLHVLGGYNGFEKDVPAYKRVGAACSAHDLLTYAYHYCGYKTEEARANAYDIMGRILPPSHELEEVNYAIEACESLGSWYVYLQNAVRSMFLERYTGGSCTPQPQVPKIVPNQAFDQARFDRSIDLLLDRILQRTKRRTKRRSRNSN